MTLPSKNNLKIEISGVSLEDTATLVGIMEYIRLCADKGITKTISIVQNQPQEAVTIDYSLNGDVLVIDAADFDFREALASDEMEVVFELGK